MIGLFDWRDMSKRKLTGIGILISLATLVFVVMGITVGWAEAAGFIGVICIATIIVFLVFYAAYLIEG